MPRLHTRLRWNTGWALGLVLLLGTLEPGELQASEPKDAGASPSRDEVTSYAFDDDLVAGDTSRPSGEVLLVRRKPGAQSLVRARVSFVDRLLKSVEAF
jgi:hypothetical protein